MVRRPWSGVEGDRILCYGLRTTVHRRSEAAGGVLTAKQAPHRPGTAPALGLRAGRVAAAIIEQTTTAKELFMWFRSLADYLRPRHPRHPARRRPRPACRLLLEALEGR